MRLTVVLALMTLFSAAQADAALITTPTAGGNGADGNFFDVTVGANNIVIDKIGVHGRGVAGDAENLEIWIRTGTFVGNTATNSGWTLVHDAPVTLAAGTTTLTTHGVLTIVDVTDFTLNASSVVGFALGFDNTGSTGSGASINYTNGTTTGDLLATNSDLTINGGLGMNASAGSLFGGTTAIRQWNGSIEYTVVSGAIPEPSSYLAMLGVATALGCYRRKRKA